VSVATDLAHEQQVLERQVELHKQRADTAEAAQRRAEQQLKQVEANGKRGQQQMAKRTIEAATALLVSAIGAYIVWAEDCQFARQRVQSYLAARVIPALGGPIPESPFGPDTELD
jgi:hypothetical protein